MFMNGQVKAQFDAAARAAGFAVSPDAAPDLATQVVGASCEVMPLTMRGLYYLRWALHLDVPFANGQFERRQYRFELTGEGGEYKVTATPLAIGSRPFLADDSGFVRVDE